MLPKSRMIALNPPPCRSKSATPSASSILPHGLPEGTGLLRFSIICCEFGLKTSLFGGSLRCGSTQRRANASGCSKPPTASESPFTSLRGCDPEPPPCSPFLVIGGIRYFSGREKTRCAVGGTWDAGCTPQRPQESRDRAIPAAAGDSGSSVSDTSIQAQTLSACVTLARKERAKEVCPDPSGPTISVMAPSGSPPSNNSSTA